MVEPSMSARRARLRLLVHDDERLGAVAELRLVLVAALHAQPEPALVPRDGTVQVRNGEVDGPEPERGGERVRAGPRRSQVVDLVSHDVQLTPEVPRAQPACACKMQ